MSGPTISPGHDETPGISTKVTPIAKTFLRNDTDGVITQSVRIDSAALDAANTPTTQLRASLALVRVEAAGANQGKYVPIGHANAPVAGSIVNAVILAKFVDMLDVNAVAVDKWSKGIIGGLVNEDEVIFGTADGPTIAAIKAALNLVDFRIQLP